MSCLLLTATAERSQRPGESSPKNRLGPRGMLSVVSERLLEVFFEAFESLAVSTNPSALCSSCYYSRPFFISAWRLVR